MKTQITVVTTREQELIIGLRRTGEFRQAKQTEIRDYFESLLVLDVASLDDSVKELWAAAGGTKAAESDVKGG